LFELGGEEQALGLFIAVLKCTYILHAEEMFIKASVWVPWPKCVKVIAYKQQTLHFPISISIQAKIHK
jgi:hypothetical protein